MLCPILFVIMVISLFPSLSQTRDGCQRNCGNISIPYPFGLGDDPKCYRDETMFNLFCDTTDPDRPLLLYENNTGIPILNFTLLGQMTVSIFVASDCYTQDALRDYNKSTNVNTWLKAGYRFSQTQNKFVAIGCDTRASIYDNSAIGFQSGCESWCRSITSVSNDTCSGIGCCEIAIPKDVLSLNVTLTSFRNHSDTWDFNPCSYAFLADESWFSFSVSDLMNFSQKLVTYLNYPAAPVVVDWAIGNVTCMEALRQDPANYACGQNTNCSDSSNAPGYLCHCKQGFRGNPYLQDGCQDINECEELSPCEGICSNTLGSYTCSCPKGQHGDGTRDGLVCKDNKISLVIKLTLGFSLGCVALILGTSWICWSLHQRKLNRLKKSWFVKNGGRILQQKLSALENAVQGTIVFTSEQLKAATDNYHESKVLGRGGYGTVYKGILSDKRIVAVKKSEIVDQEQIEQFINEVVILSQINHINVVKILGCCLETEVPMLVYEFINNGTLFHHLHDEESKYSISWSNRLRIAAETAGAIAYLHSSASQPIIHRDIKSANILLDEHYTAKVADFGASRLIALDQTQLSTLVQGTIGYLDPAYMQTNLLTDKSDVYSFGVVLVELLTGRKALCLDKPEAERNLAMHFVSSLKQNQIFEVIEHQLLNDGINDQLQGVANLARRCLRLDSEERPTMKEVAMELDGMRISQRHAWIEQNPEECVSLLIESVDCEDNTNGCDSMKGQVMQSLHVGR